MIELSERIKKFKEEHVPKYFTKDGFVSPMKVSILRSRVYTKIWKETEGQPINIRRAKAFAQYLKEMPLFIRPGDLLAGYYSESPNHFQYCIEISDPAIIDEYITDGVIKDDLDEWHDYQSYWDTRNLNNMIKNFLSEEEWDISSTDQKYMECRPTRHTSRTCPDNDTYLELGLNNRLETVRKKIKRLEKEREECEGGQEGIEIRQKIIDLNAMLISGEGFLHWVERYAKLAKELAQKEKDPQIRKDLSQIAEMLKWVPANPPRNFHEAIQSHWITMMGYHMIEHACHGTSYRLDQIFWPFYEKDVLIDKTLTREKALELMQYYLLLVDELGHPLGRAFRLLNQGVNYLATYTIGGVKPKDGSDACNELTILILDAMDSLRLSHPDFKFRWHPNVNEKVWKRVCEVVKSGLGQPSIKNDTTIIPGLMENYGLSEYHARTWASIGCISPGPTEYWGSAKRDAITLCPSKYLELVLGNGYDKVFKREAGVKTGDPTNFKSIDDVIDAFKKQLEWAIKKAMNIKNVGEYCNKALLKRPFASLFFHRAFDAERDIMDSPNKGIPWVNVPGTVDAFDSLISLNQLVFLDKKYTMKELLVALENNWDGYEEMRRDFVNTVKWGNNDEIADEVAVKAYDAIADAFSTATDLDGARPRPSGLVVTWMFLFAKYVGAMPNGRKLNDPMADGGCSPHGGYDRNGPMAAVLSTSKLDSKKWKASIFNQKLTPSSVEGEVGLEKFKKYVESAMKMNLDMIQFNVVSAEMLREAQKYGMGHNILED